MTIVNALAAVWCFGLVAANLALYARHRVRVAARSRRRPHYRLSLPTRLFRFFKGPIYGLILVHIVWEATQQPPPGWAVAIGAALGVASLVLLQMSLGALGVNFAPCDRGIRPLRRITSGPYRLLRHPIYVANLSLLAAIGLIYFGPVLVVAFALLAGFYGFAIHDEERVWRHPSR